mmetsp:Transcript_4948/g.15513  ORF Transcript_4948/g.15513 Transcript_4948/m.15513 type:complete len:231 (+) Transcript_4948:49-741(+)
MQPSNKYVLHYICVRARAEPIHLMLHYAKVPYERHDFSLGDLKEKKQKEQFPTSQLPVLEVRGKTQPLAQSGAIMRYLAKEHGLMSEDPFEAALQDAVFELSQEFAKVNPYVNMYPKDKNIDEFMTKGAGNGAGYPMIPKLKAASDLLGERNFFGGASPCFADFNMWHYLDNLDTLVPDILDDHANLVAWMVRVAQLDGIAQYLKTRPASAECGVEGSPIKFLADLKKKW